jgi:ArsR family transcriptional regulator
MDKGKELLCDNYEKCIMASEFLSALSNPNRVAIVCLLTTGRKNVSEIVNKLKLPQSSISLQLSKLLDKGWILREREGRKVYYKIKNQDFKKIIVKISEKFLDNKQIGRR